MARSAILVGCGRMSGAWIDALEGLAGVRLVGLVDLDVVCAKNLARDRALDVPYGADLAAMLDAAAPDIVFDVTVPVARAQVVTSALAAGCHVLCEKPMATSMEEARALIAAAEAADRQLAVIQNRRYIEGVRRIRALIGSGAIGKVTSIHTEFFKAPHFGGFREEMANVLLLDMAIHTFDAARFMLAAKPRTVYCREVNPHGSWYAHGASAFAVFEFEGGATFTYNGSWCAGGLPTSWEGRWRVVGSRGTLLWDGEADFSCEVEEPPEPGSGELFGPRRQIEVPPAADPSQTERHRSVIAAFLKALDSGVPSETAARDNVLSLAMVFGAIESAATGRPVAVENSS